MGKLLEELKPSDRVFVKFGAKTQRNEDTDETITIDPEKTLDVSYAYYQEITSNTDDFAAKTNYYKSIGRRVNLLGTAEYEQTTDDDGQTVSVPKIVPFETIESRYEAKRAAELAAQAEAKRQADEAAAAKKAADAAAKVEADAKKKAEADAAAAAKKAADEAAKATANQQAQS